MSGGGAAKSAAAWLRRARSRLRAAPDPAARARELAAEAAARADATRGRAPAEGLDWARAEEELLAAGGLEAEDPARRRARRRVAAQLHAASRHAESLAILDELAAGLRTGDRTGRGELEGARTVVLARLGRMDEAIGAARAARRSWLAAGRADAAAQVDVNLGNVLHRQERHRPALRAYRRALEALDTLGRRGHGLARAAAWLGVGNAGSFLGRGPEAREAYRHAEALFEASGREHHRLVAAYNRHYLELLEARPQAALDGLAAVREGFEELGDRAATTNCDLDLAEVFLHLRTWPEAERAGRRALASARDLGLDTEAARAAVHLARALAERGGSGRAAEAEARLEEAEGIFEREGNAAGLAHARVLRAELLLRRGRAAQALGPARRAVRELRRQGVAPREAAALVAEARALLADAPAPSSRRAARARLDRAARLGRAGKWSALESRSLLARLDFEEGLIARARRGAESAARLAEELSAELESDRARSAFLGDLHAVFRDGVRYWLSAPRPDLVRAFSLAERSRCFALRQGRRLAPSERRRALEAFAAPAGTRGASVGALVDDGPVEPPSAAALPVLELGVVQDHLGAGELLVSYQCWPRRGGGEAVALVVDRTSAKQVLLPAADLEERVSLLAAAAERSALLVAADAPEAARRAARSRIVEHAAALARVLVEPLAGLLEPARRLLLVPDGPLHGLPFGLLPGPGGGAPLGLDRELLQLPSASWLARRSRRRKKPGPLLAAGLADEAAPLVDRELRAVVRAARRGGRRARLLRGTKARFAAFAEAVPEAGIVHFAGHGSFRWDGPEMSALRFADGWASLTEIEGVDFHADLTVLSACRGGAVRAGGGQFAGLTRALLRAGSRSVLASPWTVSDRTAARFFAAFHRELAAGRPAPAALRAALGAEKDPTEALSFALVGAPWCGPAGRGRTG